ncbi:AraC family transcriptional regulator [Bdellovibrio svalbardensis]|uniref:AraC family transcriptional regulator n=1 Tax=Bdellovibrio svalbardensis TaxID=2972972 RepID=A0ABT6DIN5_9BACT|nr:AraC family transcriptional regulator [Bdellovibrio svalbardensis]MDG0816690.1 AraC family transcriptional regulator [Bdellovibrio svalbardensis]
MAKNQKIILSHFHRSQIGRAQRFMRLHFSDDLALKKIAKEAGSSSFHFGRLFQAYTGETTFAFLRRVRLSLALRMLQEDALVTVTEVALSVGYETPSAFNKVFKKCLQMSPGEFRNLGKAKQDEVLYNLNNTHSSKEIAMNLNLKPDFLTRPACHFISVRHSGPFVEVAMPAWNELFPLLGDKFVRPQVQEYLGLSIMDPTSKDESSMTYDAGVVLDKEPQTLPNSLHYQKIPSGRYARFILTGPYHHVWPAFEKIFQTLGESKIKLRAGACIENYVNDPNVTPEQDLITELLIPVE